MRCLLIFLQGTFDVRKVIDSTYFFSWCHLENEDSRYRHLAAIANTISVWDYHNHSSPVPIAMGVNLPVMREICGWLPQRSQCTHYSETVVADLHQCNYNLTNLDVVISLWSRLPIVWHSFISRCILLNLVVLSKGFCFAKTVYMNSRS